MKPVCAAVAAVVLLATVATARAAGPYDGSAAMSCRIQHVMSCSDSMICVQGTAATVLLPPVISVDVPNKRLGGGAAGRNARIVSVGQGGNRLVIHGEEVEMSGTAWNVAIDQKSGALTGAVLPHVGGYLVFGSCAER